MRLVDKTILIALVLVCSGASWAGTEPGSAPAAMNLAYEDINPRSATHGQEVALSDLWSERGIVLSFVASWCGYCRKELPDLQALHAAGAARVVGVVADEGDETGKALQMRQLIDEAELTMPMLYVPSSELKRVESFYDYSILPATYLIDRGGAVRKVFEGQASRSALSAGIENWLAP